MASIKLLDVGGRIRNLGRGKARLEDLAWPIRVSSFCGLVITFFSPRLATVLGCADATTRLCHAIPCHVMY